MKDRNLLFFDIECANCFGGTGKIYSFGYLLTDQNFNILQGPSDILINPDCKFDPYVRKKMLVYDRAMLKSMPKFNERYEQIKQLMDPSRVVCLGYGVLNDTHFLKDDCKRYGLPEIQADIYDVQKLIELAEGNKARKLSIEYASRFGEEEGAHRSDVDAVMTMQIAKGICQNGQKTLAEYFDI